MAYRGLDEFLIRLEQSRELVRISTPVRATEDITRISQDHPHKAVYFEHVADTAFPIVTNLFSTEKRLAWALGVESLHSLTDKINELIPLDEPLSFGTLLSRAGAMMNALRSAGIGNGGRVRDIPVQAVKHTQAPTLAMLPIPQFYPQETHHSITMAQIVTVSPETGRAQTHLARAVWLDAHTLGIELRHCIAGHGKRIPAAVVLGGDPAAMWCASVPLPSNIAPYWLAGWLRRKAVPFCHAVSQPLEVPADAEIVIEGTLHMDEIRHDVTFACNNGFFVEQMPFVAMHVTAITHRTDAIFPVHVPQALSPEYHLMNKAVERLLLPLLGVLLEDVKDLNQPKIGVGRNLTIISLKHSTKTSVRRAMHGIWGLGNLAHSKAIIVVDRDINPHDEAAVFNALLQNVDWQQDIILLEGGVHPHDASGTEPAYSGKIAVDATNKQSPHERMPTPTFNTAGIDTAWHIWDNIGVVHLQDTGQIAHIRAANPHHHLIFVEQAIELSNREQVAWYVFACVDWSRDIHITPQGYVTIHAHNHQGMMIPLDKQRKHGTVTR